MIKHDVRGDGPLVVLLHSGGMSSRQWKRLAERLATAHRVVSPDFLGSGENEPWPDERPFDFHMDVAAVTELLDQYGPAAHLVGHSYGGLVALTIARERPATVLSLALYDPVAFGVLYAANDEPGLAGLPDLLDDATGGSDAWFEKFVDYWNGPGSWAGMPPPARAAFSRVGRKVYAEVRSLSRDRTPSSAYGAVEAKALLLTGERSPISAQRVVALLAGPGGLPSASVVTIPGAGHMGPITHQHDVNAAIAALIAAVSSPPASG